MQQRTTELALRELRVELQNVNKRTANLETYLPWVLLPLTILVGLLASGGVIGLVTSFKIESRQTEWHERQTKGHDLAVAREKLSETRVDQWHNLAIKGEEASQKRAAESHIAFFRGSEETLTLVNDTLQLAKDASERAATAMGHKALERLMELDRDLKTTLSRVYDERDFKAVVKNDAIREALADMARKVANSEGMLEAQEVGLTPHCLFAKGLDLHLKSAPRPAILCLQEVPTDSDHDLSALALYWAAYESNNIGNFDKAVEHLQQARGRFLTEEHRAQHYELSRCEIQARFFDMAWNQSTQVGERRSQIEGFAEEIEELVSALRDNRGDIIAERGHCKETLGDMMFWAARRAPREVSDVSPTDEQRSLLEDAARYYLAGGDHVWAQLGLAQARWALGDQLEDEEYATLHSKLVVEGVAHREPRTLALRHAAVMIVEGEYGAPSDSLHQSWRYLSNDVLGVSEDITIFSPWQKRNVPRSIFIDEAQTYYQGKIGGPAGAKESVAVRGYQTKGISESTTTG